MHSSLPHTPHLSCWFGCCPPVAVSLDAAASGSGCGANGLRARVLLLTRTLCDFGSAAAVRLLWRGCGDSNDTAGDGAVKAAADDDDDDGGGDVSGGFWDDTSSVASASTGTSLVSSGAVSVWSIDSNHHHQLHHHHQHGGQSDEYDDLNSHAHCTTTSTSTSPAPPSPVPLALGRSSGARDAVSVRAPQHWGVMEPHACDRDGDSDERSDSAASDC